MDDRTNNGNNNLVKRCRICGDRALGFNFNGLSCESCKAFFRRNAFKQKLFRCDKGGNCRIDLFNRKSCQLCRLDKCFAIGMKKELIVLEKEKRKQFQQQLQQHDTLILDKSDEDSNNTNDADKCENIAFNFLPEYELQRLLEVKNALATKFCDETSLPVVRHVEDMYEMFNLVGIYVMNVVKFCQQISAFECLKHDDQLIILKKFFFDILVIRISYIFDDEKDGFPIIENESQENAIFIKLTTLTQWKKAEIYPFFQKFHSSLKYEMENDPTIRDLIIGQSLFSPKSNISCPEFIRYQYFVYSRLLKRYLICKYENIERADLKYTALMTILKDAKYIREIITDIYSAMEINKKDPVLAEICNLI